jgi:CheY-like chemotaxis protein
MSLPLVKRSTDTGVVRVLLVEDNDGDARPVELILESTIGSAIHVSRARTLAEAFESIDRATPNCVVLDLGFSGANGLEAVQQIKVRAPLTTISAQRP